MKKKHKSTDQERIGYFIKTLRESKNLTQGQFADLLQTSQSAVARMEAGKQNFSTKELLKISEVLNRKIISLSDSMDFRVRGGKKLSGSINTNTSKNGALALLCVSLLNNGKTVLRSVPHIEEVTRIIEIFEEIGVSVSWINNKIGRAHV